MKRGPNRQFWQSKIDQLIADWGTIDEIDTSKTGFGHLQCMMGQLKVEEQVEVTYPEKEVVVGL